MILVVTVLGILFVTGVAFMASMSFESELIRVAQQRAGTQPVIDDVAGTIDEFLGAGFGEIIDATTGAAIIEQPDTALESLSSIPFAQTPGQFNSFSPVEPYVDDPSATPTRFVWGWFTDPQALTGDGANDFAGSNDLRINTAWQSGVSVVNYPPMPVDADGDGIVDANQVNLDQLGFTRRQIDPLAKVLNPETNPTGSVYLGLRIVPHGGMVNLADAHPTLIRELFSMGLNEDLPQDNRFFEPYSPLMEEASLRRRGMLPPRELPPTQLLGSPLDPDPNTSGADYPALYWPNETAADHRHWPFTPDEFADGQPNKPIWFTRMDPESANSNNPVGDDYDRRHLATSISHDDLLRRATVIDAGGQRMDVVDWALANGIDPSRFPYLDYPSGPGAFANTYTGADMTFNRFDWSDCEGDPDCELNPRKGRLRLSMAWLDEMWPTDPARATRVIQDTFTLLLLNARGSEWDKDDTSNDIPPQDLDGDGVYDKPGKRVLDPEFDAIAETAAALTANMIDFFDFDNVPTAVEIRGADYTAAPTQFGVGTGEFVYGLEIQPYITEVAAKVVEHTDPQKLSTADPANSSYAIELFNPNEERVILGDYFLRIQSTAIGSVDEQLSGVLNPGKFKTYRWTGDQGDFSATEKMTNLDFQAGRTIELIRDVGGVKIVVDQFDLMRYPTFAAFALQGGDEKPHSVQRYARTGFPWYATVPHTTDLGIETIGQSTKETIPLWKPVEAIIANEGSFSTAFPTTGSLLLLKRFANSQNAAFTSRLSSGPLPTGPPVPHPIDDGRMPIYDVEDEMFHHINPSEHPTNLQLSGATALTAGHSGTIEHLPWGQLVFDYFTALPLENPGPYGDYDDYKVNDPLKYLRPEQPRVDMDGMRAHGRIDINAAPWFVMKGLPFIPMKLVPQPFKDTFRLTLDLDILDDDNPQPIGEVRAQAIAAYRDQRLIKSSDLLTGYKGLSGDYNTDITGANFGRGWIEPAPKIRRGMGFLSVGELANVRHPAADSVVPGELRMRLDDSVVGADDVSHLGTYLEAVAALACLSDWVSVRSQVFTAYGTLRGDKDPTIEDDDLAVQEEMQSKDVDTRAIRFQETIDRLPTFLGAEEPSRIGSRVLATYNDVRND